MALKHTSKRKFTNPTGSSASPIDISSDDAESPPPKRQKSFTPTETLAQASVKSKINASRPRDSQSAPSTTRPASPPPPPPPPSSEPRLPTPKKSPFKNIPSWSAQAQASDTNIPVVTKIKFNPRTDTSIQQNGNYEPRHVIGNGSPTDNRPRAGQKLDVEDDDASGLLRSFQKGTQVFGERSKPLKFSTTTAEGLASRPHPASKILDNVVMKTEPRKHTSTLPVRPSPSPSIQQSRYTASTVPLQMKKFEIVIPSPSRPPGNRQNSSIKSVREAMVALDIAEKEERTLRFVSLAQPKKRKIDRKFIPLDIPKSSHDPVEKRIHSQTFTHPKEQVKEVLTARFRQKFDPPLTFANNVNDRRLNGKFQFVDKYIFRAGVKSADPGTNYGCECGVVCNPRSCRCLAIDVADNIGGGHRTEYIPTYTRRNDGLKVLCDTYIQKKMALESKHTEISECNEFCGCGPNCWNRVISQGRTVPLEIFETNRCGFGVRSTIDIVKGQFIELYLGEVITTRELETRESAAPENAPAYIFSLDWFSTTDTRYHIDGEYFGSAMRFVNHSCDSNSRTFTVQTHKEDKHVYYLAFFAIKDIPAGTEITVDYLPQETARPDDINPSHTSISPNLIDPYRPNTSIPARKANLVKVIDAMSSSDESESHHHSGTNPESKNDDDDDDQHDDDVVKCLCGSANCRGRLWAPGKKQRRRKRLLPRKD